MSSLRAVVLGGGSWGTTAAHLLSHNVPTTLWVRDKTISTEISETHRNSRYLPGVELHQSLKATVDLEAAVGPADLVVFAVPTGSVRDISKLTAPLISERVVVVSLAKGFEPDTNLRMTQVLTAELGARRTGLLTGPNLCKEILAGLPASGVVAFNDPQVATTVQRCFTTPAFRVFTNQDVIGCELGGALKNVYVIAGGIVEGLNLGDNARAAVITRSLSELAAFSVALGGKDETLRGLAGVGDLVASCMSPQSRNATVGRELGRGRGIQEIVATLGQVAEGVSAVRAVYELSRSHQVPMPIADLVYEICWRGGSATEAAAALLRNRLGAE